MNDDERFLKDWLDDVPDPAGARQDADQIMARIPETKQRSRWWPLLPARRSRPRSSSDGQPPTVNGRTRTMFSPLKTITAGALAFAIGGAFLVAQPFSQQPTVPGAETDDVAATWVTGTVQPARNACRSGSSDVDGGVLKTRNTECSPQTWTSSDPRLTGKVSRRWNEDTYLLDDGFTSVGMGTAYLRNGGGSWVCSASDLAKGSGYLGKGVTGTTTHNCIGDGGYEGLSAILANEQAPDYSEEFVGLIFSGDFPPLPEPPASE